MGLIMAHRDICIRFIVEKAREARRYKAVGFLNQLEAPITSYEMFNRVDKSDGGAIGEEDDKFIFECLDQLPETFQSRRLVTNRRGPGGNMTIFSSFYFLGFGWFRRWVPAEDVFGLDYLVICRDDDSPSA